MTSTNSFLQELIKKLSKKREKIIFSDEIKSLTEKIMGAQYTDKKCYKLIYYLKNKGHLLSIKKNIFYVKNPEDHLSEDLILEDRYRYILHTHCKERTDNQRYIGGLKALELSLSNFDIPEHILIVNVERQSLESVVTGKSVQFKKYTSKKENHYRQFKKHTTKVKMGKYSYPFATRELALLESLYNFDEQFERYTLELIKKIVKKSKSLDIERIEKIIKIGKHHSSINRLYKIARQVNSKFAEQLLPLIKKRSFVLDI